MTLPGQEIELAVAYLTTFAPDKSSLLQPPKPLVSAEPVVAPLGVVEE
jgi:hypothetical protein